MDIKEFESQIQIGDKVKIQSGHVRNTHTPGWMATSQTYIFMGYEPCTRCKRGNVCPGYIHLQKESNRAVNEKTCYRSYQLDNIRLVLLKHRYLPEDLFEI